MKSYAITLYKSGYEQRFEFKFSIDCDSCPFVIGETNFRNDPMTNEQELFLSHVINYIQRNKFLVEYDYCPFHSISDIKIVLLEKFSLPVISQSVWKEI